MRAGARLIRILACTIAIAGSASRVGSQPVKSDQEVLVELEKSWNEAFYSKDLKFIESILADEFMSTYEDGSRADKKKELAATAAFDQQVVRRFKTTSPSRSSATPPSSGSPFTWSASSRDSAPS